MERPLIPGWLVVEFPDCKEQTITFKRGWVCVGGWRAGHTVVRFGYSVGTVASGLSSWDDCYPQ